MPAVEVVDMAEEFREGHRSMFSRALTTALTDIRDRGSKAVLFLNRRGFASFVLCRECGVVPRCENCSVALTYHEVGARLVCHHCGATCALPSRCPRCSSPFLRQFGAGTQRVESELAAVLPGLTGPRVDAVKTVAASLADALRAAPAPGWSVLGPSPAPLAKVKNAYRWHVLLKAPAGADVSGALWDAMQRTGGQEDVAIAPDVDPSDMM